MAKGKKTGGKNFQPGVVTNPNGRPKIPEDVKIARKYTSTEIDTKLNEILFMDREALKKIKDDPNASILDLCLQSIVTYAINKGDHMRLDFLLNRIVGKVVEKQEVEVSSKTLQIIIDAKEPGIEKYAL